MSRSILFILCVNISACATGQLTLQESILGRWQMERVVMDGSNDVSDEHNPENNRYILLDEDRTFETGGAPHGLNTGRWTLDASTATLHLDSDAGEDDDSYWIVSVEGDRMHWQGTRFEFNSRFAIEHVRMAP